MASISSRAVSFVLSSRERVLLTAVLVAVLLGLVEWWFTDYLLHLGAGVHDATVDALQTGTTSGAFAWVVLTGLRDRRVRTAATLRRVAELNHHIRNALTVIEYQTAFSRDGAEAAGRIHDSVQRISDALTLLDDEGSDR